MRAHNAGGWSYEFHCSNMVESFNKLLLGIHGMPVNAIIQFTFYNLVAWFNDRHAHALKLWSDGEIWAPKPKAHLEKANERAAHMRLHVLTMPQGLIRSSIGAVQCPTARSESRGCMW